ncbi:hypothetical protein [Pseudovibrio sp. JE062]|uniref:hypothetical protein n=1 Tax=Pseudovibrio sp. JE062 TaxID=439495 RepID=UPI000186C75B|nr:hypothetical protein [Pseudovibrio sp. JE062]EEA95310.1 hypothetical protein PJE062_2881 [Pseudovibrio sp. JE062]
METANLPRHGSGVAGEHLAPSPQHLNVTLSDNRASLFAVLSDHRISLSAVIPDLIRDPEHLAPSSLVLLVNAVMLQ